MDTLQWPHIARFLRVNDSTGRVDADYLAFHSAENTLNPADAAAAYEEWAEFYEFHLGQRTEELAGNHHKRNLVERWTDEMAYSCRRSAAAARGEHPGKPVPLSERRPDLDAAMRAIATEITAEPVGVPDR
jgi:hypothetical protein